MESESDSEPEMDLEDDTESEDEKPVRGAKGRNGKPAKKTVVEDLGDEKPKAKAKTTSRRRSARA